MRIITIVIIVLYCTFGDAQRSKSKIRDHISLFEVGVTEM
jgi:hypothetical protein